MFSLLAKNQPEYSQDTDTRSYAERVADAKKEFGIEAMSDEEIAQLSSNFSHPAQEAASHEKRIRRNAQANLTPAQTWENVANSDPASLR